MVEMVVVIAILAMVSLLVVQSVGSVREEAEKTVARANLCSMRDAFCGTAAASGCLADMKYIPGFSNSLVRIGYLLEAPTNYPAFTNFDPVTRRGWHGPYVQDVRPVDNTNETLSGCFPAVHDRRCATDTTFGERGFYAADYGATNDPALADPWGNPVVLQMPTNELSDDELLQYARLVSAGPNGVLDTPLDRLAGREADGTASNRLDDIVLFLKRADVYEP